MDKKEAENLLREAILLKDQATDIARRLKIIKEKLKLEGSIGTAYFKQTVFLKKSRSFDYDLCKHLFPKLYNYLVLNKIIEEKTTVYQYIYPRNKVPEAVKKVKPLTKDDLKSINYN